MAKKKWDENNVSRDKSGRFVAQTNVPQLGGQGEAYGSRMLKQWQNDRLRTLQQNTGPGVIDSHRQLHQQRLNTLQDWTSQAKPRQRRTTGLG